MNEFSDLEENQEQSYALCFPEGICCNCGTPNQLKIVEQDTRYTRFYGVGGTELVFVFYLPFCPRCEETSERRPQRIFHRLLQFALFFLVFASVLIMWGLAVNHGVLVEQSLTISLCISFIAMSAVLFFQRAKSPQSSHFQPVRIISVERRLLTEKPMGLTLRFTCRQYRQAFLETNRKAISDEVLKVL